MNIAIKVDHLTKCFKVYKGRASTLKSALLSSHKAQAEMKCALNDISFAINHKETVAIIGKNGSGKSTLLSIIGKVYKPTSGQIIVNGKMSTMLELGSGFHPELTGRENVFFNAAVLGLSNKQIISKLDSIIDFSELWESIDAPVRTYSAGMMMRLGFAIATEVDPDILLVDEVLAVGDGAFQEKCYERIDNFKNDGKTIVFVTHDLDAARLVANRTIWINQGKIQMDGLTPMVLDAYLETIPKHHDVNEV